MCFLCSTRDWSLSCFSTRTWGPALAMSFWSKTKGRVAAKLVGGFYKLVVRFKYWFRLR